MLIISRGTKMRCYSLAVLGSIFLHAAGSAATQANDVGALVPRTWNGARYACKCYYGDACWPSPNQWRALNTTVGGNLVIDIPPGAPCYQVFQGPLGNVSTYDAAKCADLTTKFVDEQWTTDQPATALWTYFTNDTCRPTTNPSDTCTLGYYPVYVILAKTKEHVKAGVDFARKNSLRLIIRNTGHDFIGRSVGWGALVVNTHSFQDVAFVDSWTGPGKYRGSAVTIGAGVQGRALLRLAHAQNPPKVVVTGECPTVGVAGGLVQGGGHGPWTTLKGFAADNALEFHAVTAAGDFVVANAQTNADLFWALKGGGPSAFAVVLSVTFKTFTDLPSAGSILDINGTHTTNATLFWEGVKRFHKYSNRFVDSGLYAYYEMGNFGALRLHIQPFVAIGQTTTQLLAILKPLYDELNAIGLNYSAVTKGYNSFFDLYIDMFEDEQAGGSALTGGWMFPHQDVATNNQGIVDAMRQVVDNQGFIVGHLWDAGHGLPATEWGNSAVNPKFRTSTDFIITILLLSGSAPLAEKAATQQKLTYVIDEPLRQAAPHGCAYVNEGDPFQPNWQEHFWGTNYPTLFKTRKKWDPNGVFYAVSTPGTEGWEQIEVDTRLCKRL
ncbi:FAD-binding domain-containing protein [Thozetella sp. PMI_491]|nr:FAD-binding domain-containing protein [Thozetella sp. PMI_491]